MRAEVYNVLAFDILHSSYHRYITTTLNEMTGTYFGDICIEAAFAISQLLHIHLAFFCSIVPAASLTVPSRACSLQRTIVMVVNYGVWVLKAFNVIVL